jgi:hypothetical protein
MKISYAYSGGTVNIFQKLKNLWLQGIDTLSSGTSRGLRRGGKPRFPLADRLLADALRLAELPSPTPREERRAAFVLERLNTLDLSPAVDEEGNILVRAAGSSNADKAPLLLFTDLGSTRWHPLESLARLDADYARGAGLADILGTAALLSVAEGITQGNLSCDRDLLLLFAAHSFNDPESKALLALIENPKTRPCAGLGIRGLTLGGLVTRAMGTYRLEINFAREEGEDRAAPDSVVIDTLLAIAGKLSGIVWDSEGTTRLYIRRISAGVSFEHSPAEGIMEVELESSDAPLLDMAMNTIKATVGNAGQTPGVRITIRVLSFLPVGNSAVNENLSRMVSEGMQNMRIKVREESGADTASVLSEQRIPALSLGIAAGREGLTRDHIEIDSIEKGRSLLESLILRLSREDP